MVPKLKLLFTKAGWSTQPYSIDFDGAPLNLSRAGRHWNLLGEAGGVAQVRPLELLPLVNLGFLLPGQGHGKLVAERRTKSVRRGWAP